jgi:kynurenine formamidase
MCSPIVLEAVRLALSRRAFIGAAAAAGAAGVASAAQGTAKPAPRSFRTAIDLTHPFSPSLPVYPGYKPVQVRERFSIARDGFSANEVTYDEHTGTHVDAPSHFVRDGASADRIAIDRLVAPLAVISIADRAARNADAVVTAADLLEWEKRHGRLPAGAFVAMHAGWSARVANVERFLNRDAKGVLHMPGFSEEAARVLVQRDVVGVGVDTLSLDPGNAQKFAAHITILGAGKYGVEMIANLDRVPPTGATIVVGAPTHAGATGGPARIIALI